MRWNWPAALNAAPKRIKTLLPADTEKGAAELVEAPAGSWVKDNLQVGRKTVLAGDRMLSGELVLPCETVTELAESPMEKSGEGGGLASLLPPPPEETRAAPHLAPLR